MTFLKMPIACSWQHLILNEEMLSEKSRLRRLHMEDLFEAFERYCSMLTRR